MCQSWRTDEQNDFRRSMAAILVNRYNDSLRDPQSNNGILVEVRNAFVGGVEDDNNRAIQLHLLSEEKFLVNLLDALDVPDINIKRAIAIVDILYFALYSQVPATGDFVVRWLSSMRSTTFLSSCRDAEQSFAHEAARLRSLLELVTLEMTEAARDVPLTAETLESDFYLSSPGTAIKVHDLIMELSSSKDICAMVCMSWGMFLHRLLRNLSEGEPHDPAYSTFVDHVFSDDKMEPHRYLIELAIGSRLLAKLDIVLESLPEKNDNYYYSVMLNFFLSAQTYFQVSESTSVCLSRLIKSRALANTAWNSQYTMQILNAVRQQFPHESRPFLRLIRALARSGTRTVQYLDKIPTYTQALPVGFTDFNLLSEEADAKALIELNHPLDLYSSQHLHGGVTIAAGSRGLLLKIPRSNSIVMWQHDYSALHYLARVLQSSIAAFTATLYADIVGEILGLLSTLLVSTDDGDDFLQSIENEIGVPLPGMVFDIYEQVVQARGSPALLVECAHFFEALFRVDPETAWAYVGQISLFQTLDQVIEALVSANEDAEAYTLLISICRLLSGAISGLISTALRSDARLQRTKTQFLVQALKGMRGFYKVYLHWPATNPTDRHRFGSELNLLFTKLIKLDSASHLAEAPQTKPVREIISSANAIVLSTFDGMERDGNVLLANFEAALESCLSKQESIDDTAQQFIRSTFSFFGTVLLHGKNASISRVRRLLFSRSRDLMQILERNRACRIPVIELLLDILESDGDPLPSLIALFGPEKASLKSTLLTFLDECSRTLDETSHLVWQLLHKLMQPNQEGIALYLLGQGQEDASSSVLDNIVQSILIIDVERWSPQHVSVVLDVLFAAQYWSSLTHTQLQSKSSFWVKLREIFSICTQKIVSQSDEVHTVYDSYRLVCAGLLARIFAAHLACMSRSEWQTEYANIEALLNGMTTETLTIGHYRASLHGNLSRNVSQKYPGFKLDALRCRQSHRTRFGDSFFFDIHLAEQMIPANSFLRELRTANCNLSLIDAQAVSAVRASRYRTFTDHLSDALEDIIH